MDGPKRQLLAKSLLTALLPIISKARLSEEDGCMAYAVSKNEVKGYDVSVGLSLYSDFEPVTPFKYNIFDIGFNIIFKQCMFNNEKQAYEWISEDYEINHSLHNRSIVWGWHEPGTYRPELAVKGVKDIGLGDDKAIAKLIFNTLAEQLDKATTLNFAKKVFALSESTALRPNMVK